MRASARIILLLSCVPALMGADIYRWVDENGVVNYTQQKPVNVPSERLDSDTGRLMHDAPPAPPEAAAPAESGQPPADRLTDAQREALQGLEVADQARRTELDNIRKANCERAQGVLDRLSAFGRLRVRNADGSERMMTEDERNERVAEAQVGVVENCVENAPG